MVQHIKNITILFFLLLSLSVSACSKDDFTPAYPKSEGVTRLVSYNVGVFAKYAKSGYKMTARMMKELDADAVCMQELDSCTTRTKHVFQVKRFAELMGWEYVYAKAMPYQGGYYGTGLACKDKILKKSETFLHTFSVIVLSVLHPFFTVAVADLEDYIIASTHLDLQKETQLEEVEVINKTFTELYKDCPKPIFLLGDMNAEPNSETIQMLKTCWDILSVEGNTYSSHNPDKCIDFILQLKNGVKCEVIESKVPTVFHTGDVTQASDHLPIYVDVKIPKN